MDGGSVGCVESAVADNSDSLAPPFEQAIEAGNTSAKQNVKARARAVDATIARTFTAFEPSHVAPQERQTLASLGAELPQAVG